MDEVGLLVDEVVGILPPLTPAETEAAVADRYGNSAAEFYCTMREFAPDALLGARGGHRTRRGRR